MTQYAMRIHTEDEGWLFTDTTSTTVQGVITNSQKWHQLDGNVVMTGRGFTDIFSNIRHEIKDRGLSGFDQISEALPEVTLSGLHRFVKSVSDLPEHITVDMFLDYAREQAGGKILSVESLIMGYSQNMGGMAVAMCPSYPIDGKSAFHVDRIADPGFIFFLHLPTVKDFVRQNGKPSTKAQMLRCMRQVFKYERSEPKPFQDLVLGGGVVHCTQVFKDRVISEPIGPLEVGTGLSLVKSKRKKIKKTFGKNKK